MHSLQFKITYYLFLAIAVGHQTKIKCKVW